MKEIGREEAVKAYEALMKKNKEIGEPRERETRSGLETHIYIIRHGTSTPEVEDGGSLQDRDFDRELSPQGEKEADAAGEKIAEDIATYIDNGIIVLPGGSTLPRAHKTSERAMRAINRKLGYPYNENWIPDPTVRGPVARVKEEKEARALNSRYSVPNYIHPPHAMGKQRLKDQGLWGRGETLPDTWMRDPRLLQEDIVAAGLGETFNANDIITERTNNFKRVAEAWEMYGRALRRHWEKDVEKNPEEGIKKLEGRKGGGINISAEHPPHVVFIGGTHGAIVPEAWLHEIIKKYEEKTGKIVSPTLEYAEYFTVHIPATEKEIPTLTIHDHTMPIPWEMFNVTYTGAKKEIGQTKED